MKTFLRIIAALLLVGGVIGFGIALYSLYSPSDEQKMYESRSAIAEEKVKAANDAKGRPDEAQKAEEAKSAIHIAETWREGMVARQGNYKFGMIVSTVMAVFAIVILLATFLFGRKAIT